MHPQAEAGVKILQDLLDGQRTDNASQKQHSQAQESPQDDQELAELLS